MKWVDYPIDENENLIQKSYTNNISVSGWVYRSVSGSECSTFSTSDLNASVISKDWNGSTRHHNTQAADDNQIDKNRLTDYTKVKHLEYVVGPPVRLQFYTPVDYSGNVPVNRTGTVFTMVVYHALDAQATTLTTT